MSQTLMVAHRSFDFARFVGLGFLAAALARSGGAGAGPPPTAVAPWATRAARRAAVTRVTREGMHLSKRVAGRIVAVCVMDRHDRA